MHPFSNVDRFFLDDFLDASRETQNRDCDIHHKQKLEGIRWVYDFIRWHERNLVGERIVNESFRGRFAQMLEHLGLTVEKHSNLGRHHHWGTGKIRGTLGFDGRLHIPPDIDQHSFFIVIEKSRDHRRSVKISEVKAEQKQPGHE